MSSSPPSGWWGSFPLPPSGVLRVRIGPLEMFLRRRAQEWSTWTARSADALSMESSVEVVDAVPEEGGGFVPVRYALGATGDALRLEPVLADRPVVVAPEVPLSLPAGQRVTLFVSTPVTLRISDGGLTLADVPVLVPNETWFGPSTIEGELAYASRTSGRLSLEELPHRPSRVVTAVHVHNLAKDAMAVERIKLPVQFLGVWEDPADHHLWTEAVTMERDAEGRTGRLTIAEAPPRPGAERLTAPRNAPDVGVLRAVTALFG